MQPALPRRGEGAGRAGLANQRPPEWLTDRSVSALREVHQPWHWLRDERVPRWWAYHEYLLTDHVEGSALGEHIWQRGAPFGIRSGAPLFDVELVEFVLRIPPEVKWQRIDRSLAREAVAGVLPDPVRLNRGKANIGPFYLDLISGPDSAVMRELLLDPRARVREFADGRDRRQPAANSDPGGARLADVDDRRLAPRDGGVLVALARGPRLRGGAARARGPARGRGAPRLALLSVLCAPQGCLPFREPIH